MPHDPPLTCERVRMRVVPVWLSACATLTRVAFAVVAHAVVMPRVACVISAPLLRLLPTPHFPSHAPTRIESPSRATRH